MMAEDKQKSALMRRHDQLRRWADSETNRTSAEPVKDKLKKVRFEPGIVFMAACSAGDTVEVRELLEEGGNPNTTNVDGLTALHQACIDDNFEMVEFLATHGATVNAQDNEGWTPLHATASCGYQDIARCLIENGANIDSTNSDGDLPIDIADAADMEVLLAKEMETQNIDADEARNREENLMLRDAKNWLLGSEMAEVVHSRSGATALHVAAAKGYMKVLPLLLQAGANINAVDIDGWTPLHAAAHWSQEEACKMLVEHMCDMDARSKADQTAFDVADEDLKKLLEDLKLKQQSLKNDERKESHGDETVNNSLGKQHAAYRRRSSVNRINTEDKHNMVLHKAIEEGGVLLTATRKENHVGPSNQQSDEDEEDEGETGKVSAAAGGLPGKSQEPTGATASDRFEKTWPTRRDESSRGESSSTAAGAAEPSPNKFAFGVTPGRSTLQIDGGSSTSAVSSAPPEAVVQLPETSPQPARRRSMSNQENLFTAEGGLPTRPAIAGTAIASGSGKAASRSSMAAADRSSDPVPALDLDEAKEDGDQFVDSATRPSSAIATTGSSGTSAPSLQRIDSATAPDSWRAGLRKTGSTGAVSDGGAYTPRGSSGGGAFAQATSDAAFGGASDKLVQRSLSSSVLMSGSGGTASEVGGAAASSAAGSQAVPYVTSRQPRPSSYLSSLAGSATSVAAADALDRRHSAIDRSPSSATTTTSPVAYIPFYRRKQMEREKEERERLAALAASGNSDGGSAAAESALVAGCLPALAEVISSALERRSSKFELPKRDDETETIRKMKARQARATRRSTQGVTQEDVKAAEATLKSADKSLVAAAAAAAVVAAAETSESRLGGGAGASAGSAKDPLPSPSASTVGAMVFLPPVVQKDQITVTLADEESRGEESLRQRHPWQRDESGRSSFRKAREVISSSVPGTPAPASPSSSSASTTAAAPDAGKLTSAINLDDDKDSDDKSGSRKTALKIRRARHERRSTGIPPDEVPVQEKKTEEKEGTVENTDDYKASSSRYDRRAPNTADAPALAATASTAAPSAGAASAAVSSSSTGLLPRGDRSSYRAYQRNATGVTDTAAAGPVGASAPGGSTAGGIGPGSFTAVVVEDFKKLYEEVRLENETLRKSMVKLEQDFTEARAEIERSRSQRTESRVIDSGLEKRERRALERRISELEEELQNAAILKLENDSLKSDNQRLKEENGALIRVISKLSK